MDDAATIDRRPAAKAAAPRFACLCCGSAGSSLFLADCPDFYLRKPFVVSYHRCTDCGLVQQHPLPRDVSSYYDAYPVHRARSAAYTWFRRVLMSSVYLAPRHWRAGSRLLDFGCGDGWYVEWCKASGLDAVGFEPNAGHARALSERLGLPVLWDAEELRARYAGSFDVITLHFVVEHLVDLQSTFRLLAALLAPGGTIRYVVPNVDSWEFRLFRRRWHSLDAPRHISFPASGQARRLADEAGLEFSGASSVAFPNGFGGSLSTALWGRFSEMALLATLPLSVVVTRLFPSGNRAFVLSRPDPGPSSPRP
jgi:SAM-dependent methyltransferase